MIYGVVWGDVQAVGTRLHQPTQLFPAGATGAGVVILKLEHPRQSGVCCQESVGTHWHHFTQVLFPTGGAGTTGWLDPWEQVRHAGVYCQERAGTHWHQFTQFAPGSVAGPGLVVGPFPLLSNNQA